MLAQLPIEEFITQLGAAGVPAVDYPPDELDEELAALQAPNRDTVASGG